MKRLWSVVLLCGFWLAACQSRGPDVGGTPTVAAGEGGATATVAVEPTRATPTPATPTPGVTTPTPSPIVVSEPALYLAAGTVTPSDLLPREGTDHDGPLALAEIPLQAAPLLTMGDIVAYDATTHAFTLTVEATQRLAKVHVPVAGPIFVLTVDGEPIYAGAFWTPASSLSFDGVVIMVMPDGTPAFGTYRIELGYPGPDFFQGPDPRDDPRVIGALRQAGKLVP